MHCIRAVDTATSTPQVFQLFNSEPTRPNVRRQGASIYCTTCFSTAQSVRSGNWRQWPMYHEVTIGLPIYLQWPLWPVCAPRPIQSTHLSLTEFSKCAFRFLATANYQIRRALSQVKWKFGYTALWLRPGEQVRQVSLIEDTDQGLPFERPIDEIFFPCSELYSVKFYKVKALKKLKFLQKLQKFSGFHRVLSVFAKGWTPRPII